MKNAQKQPPDKAVEPVEDHEIIATFVKLIRAQRGGARTILNEGLSIYHDVDRSRVYRCAKEATNLLMKQHHNIEPDKQQ